MNSGNRSNPAAPMSLPFMRCSFSFPLVLVSLMAPAPSEAAAPNPPWTSPNHYRALLTVDGRARLRSNSPASVEIDFQQCLRKTGSAHGVFDENTLEVVAYVATGGPRAFDATQKGPARYRLPHRIDKFFGLTKVTLHFVMPDHACTNFALYFDTLESGLGARGRYHGLVGDGDRFCEGFKRRAISASHFDQFVDFDDDGDLDLFKGGVEPFVYCYENVGHNRLVDRGRLTSGGEVFALPESRSHRSWVTVAFYDLDGDGDQDFLPSFGDGPDAGTIVFYKNTTPEHHGQLTFTRIGPLQTTSGFPLAGGAQAGGWFPSIVFVKDWDGDGVGPDALVGSNHRCWLYRRRGANANGSPEFTDAIAVQAGGKEIELVNPRFDCADIDEDGDLDLFAGTQPGPVYGFKNIGSRARPELAAAQPLAWNGKYLIGDAHSGVTLADFDGDGLLDLATGRFWERADQNKPEAARAYGGFFKNLGTRASPRFEHRARGAPFTEQSQICDALRQNGVRALDWNNDGKLDLLAGDTDGFVWYFRNFTGASFPVFAAGEKVRADRKPLSVAGSGGHARFDVCDWNNDSKPERGSATRSALDLLVADGRGTLTFFPNAGSQGRPKLLAGQRVLAEGQPIQLGGRASVLVCDWNNDGRKDLVLADDQGYYFCKNTGTGAQPLLAAPKTILFGGKPVKYVRPNLGSFVDWDGDGRKDLIGCHFENSIRCYRNIGSGAPGEEPRFADPEGSILVHGESPQMISGADAVDWNGDGDLDILTGQGHGGSGLRFYERDWIEDELNKTHPLVTVERVERRP